MLPWAEIQRAVGDGDHDFAPHDGAFEVGVGIVFGSVVRVLGVRMLGGEFFEPFFEVAVQAGFVVIDEHTGRDVHGIDQAEPLADAAFREALLDLRGDVQKGAAFGDFEPEFLAVGFHLREKPHFRREMQSPDLLPRSKGDHLITMSEALTSKQQAVRDFIEAYRQREGVSPSLREIQSHFGFASPNAAAKHLAALQRKGVLQRSAGRARGLVLSESADRLISEIPILGAIPAGRPLGESEQRDGCVRVDLDTLGIPKNARTFALRVRGDSMTGAHILDGDIVILELKPPSHGRVVAALIDGESTLKTFLVRSGKPYLRAENPDYPDLIPAQELVIQGVMVALLRHARS